ncbi:hypothetical protein BAE44_0004048 [Dichanthelium oligosanthes]|uniref:Uncharacterized protein n=1 Tax=Dichanthelium oligosanthes TaxID=888268 RepID=A0A1E5WC43_9POAL|nr:hypothetical protein BAE44_0004048 [Dichanthelium oligosanthes]
MASRRGSSSCALCEGSNLPSCCAACVNARLVEYHTRLRMMRSLRDSLQARFAARLEAKSKADEQRIWRVSKTQDIMELRDRLTELKRKTAIEKTKVQQSSSDLKAQTASLNLAFVTLKKRRADAVGMHTNAMKVAQMNLMATTSERLKMQSKSVKQLCRLFPMRRVIKEGEKKEDYSGPYDSICGARLPRGLDPHSVPSEELSAALGLYFALIPTNRCPNDYIPSFSYSLNWNALLLIKISNFMSEIVELKVSYCFRYMLHFINIAVRILSAPALHVSGFKVRSSSLPESHWSYCNTRLAISIGFMLTNMATEFLLEYTTVPERGISLLKTSVTAITTYYYNSLGLDVPSNLSTFEAFAKLLHMLSSSKALRAALESNIATRSEKQAQQLNRSIWKASSAISSESSFMDSMHTTIMPSTLDNLLLNSNESFLYTGKLVKHGGTPDSILDGWDLVEREVLPPPPSQVENVAQWERAITEITSPCGCQSSTLQTAEKKSICREAFPPFHHKPADLRLSCAAPPLPPPRLTLSFPASPAMSSLRAISSLLIYSSSAAAGRGARRLGYAPVLGGSFKVPSSSGPPAFVLDEVARAAGGARRRASTRAESWDSEKSPYETLVRLRLIRIGNWLPIMEFELETRLTGVHCVTCGLKSWAGMQMRRLSRQRTEDWPSSITLMASQAWMEWVMKKRKAFDQRGDMAVAAWAEQQQREMTLRARRLSRSKVDPEEERKLFAKEKKASMEFYSTTLKRHTLVLRKRDIMRKKAEEERNKEISRLLAAEGLELDTDEDEDKTFLG